MTRTMTPGGTTATRSLHTASAVTTVGRPTLRGTTITAGCALTVALATSTVGAANAAPTPSAGHTSAAAVVHTVPRTAAPAAASPTVRTSSADIDGDGRADRTTFTKGSTKDGMTRYVLQTRTATGHRATLPMLIEDGGAAVGDVWMGTAGIDGRRGAEVCIDPTPGHDFTSMQVYTWSKGRFASVANPGGRSANGGRYDWVVANHPSRILGYTFSMRRGVRYVVRHDLPVVTANVSYRGTHTTYRWSRGGWARVSTKRTGLVSDASAQRQYAGLFGLVWR